MQCTQCHERPAVIQFTQVADDQVVTLHLCERCAAEKGVETLGQLTKTPIGNLVASLGQDLAAATAAGSSPAACARCGATFENFREAGRLGCPECYQAFAAPLRELLRRLHGSSRHLGRRYGGQGGAAGAGPTAVELREQLRRAVETEQFELAAELRDQLRGLE